MACLSRSAELRRTLPQKAALTARLRRYSERYGFLGKMLAVLDDEPLVVLHPKTARGFRFVMGGIADNFQLHLLLLAALAGEGPDQIPGTVPPTEAVAASSDGVMEGTPPAVQSRWQLANWFALRADAEIDVEDKDKSWIWNEGVPADIAPFEGSRVVLIGPSTIQRGWRAGRAFSGDGGKARATRADSASRGEGDAREDGSLNARRRRGGGSVPAAGSQPSSNQQQQLELAARVAARRGAVPVVHARARDRCPNRRTRRYWPPPLPPEPQSIAGCRHRPRLLHLR